MNINLSEKIAEQFIRLEELADEASSDQDESFSSRASAMTALTTIIKELTKAQSEVINMERLMKIEQTTIEVLREHLSHSQQEEFLNTLESRLTV